MCWLAVGEKHASLNKCVVNADIVDNDGSVAITQEFINPAFKATADAAEAVYNFPLQSTSAVYSFVTTFLDEEGKVLKTLVGKAKEKQAAREEYEQAKENGKTAQLLEVDSKNSPDIFIVSIGIISKECKTVKVEIKYHVELASEEDNKVKRFTLPATVAKRYGNKEKSAFGSENVKVDGAKFEFQANISLSQNLSMIESPTHKITTKLMVDGSPKKASVSFANDDNFLSADLTLKLGGDGNAKSSLIIQNPESIANEEFTKAFGDSTIAKLDFTVKKEEQVEGDVQTKKDFIFVVDRSGSMSGGSMKNCIKALQLCLSSLPESCSFNICSFGSSHSFLFSEGSRDYSEATLNEAREHVDSMKANMGGTEILKPFQDILSKQTEIPQVLFLLTDGQVYNTDAVVSLVKKAHSEKATKVFTCGIGSGVSQHLVEGVAKAAGGTATFIAFGERMNAKMAAQMRQARQDPYTDLRLNYGSILLSEAKLGWDPNSLLPKFSFDGQRVSLYMAVGIKSVVDLDQNDSKITLSGSFKGKAVTLGSVSLKESLLVDGNLIVPALREQVTKTEQSKEKKSARKRATELAVCANVVTKYTSLVAVELKANGDELESKPVNVRTIQSLLPPVPIGQGIRSTRQQQAFGGGGIMYSMAPPGPPMMMKKLSRSTSSAAPRQMALMSSPKRRMKKKSNKVGGALGSGMPQRPAASPVLGRRSKGSLVETLDEEVEEFAQIFSKGIMAREKEVKAPRAKVAESLSDYDVMDVLIKLQKPNGSFVRSDELLKALKLTSLGSEGDDESLITAIVVKYLQKKLASLKDEWELLSEKALKWLKSNSTNVDDLLAQADKLIA